MKMFSHMSLVPLQIFFNIVKDNQIIKAAAFFANDKKATSSFFILWDILDKENSVLSGTDAEKRMLEAKMM